MIASARRPRSSAPRPSAAAIPCTPAAASCPSPAAPDACPCRPRALLAAAGLRLPAATAILPALLLRLDAAELPGVAPSDSAAGSPAVIEQLALALADRSLCLRADLMPAVSLPVYSYQTGILAQVRVRPGDRVAAGDTLARLEDQLGRLEHQAARVRIEQTRARLDQARPALAQGWISQRELEQLEQEARLAEQRAVEAGLTLARTVLTAPVAGVVAEHRLQPGQPVAAGQECFRVEDPVDLVAELAVPLPWVPRLRLGQTLPAQVVGAPDLPPLSGRLERLARTIDPASGGCLGLVRFAQAGHRLRPGTPVRVVLREE